MDKNVNQTKTVALSLPAILTNKVTMLVFTGIFSLSFLVPFFLGHPQWLVGTIVNVCLFSAVIFLPKKFFLPLIIFPSLGVLARGVVFGPFTPFLIYFLPFIWLANLILILVFRGLTSQKSLKVFKEVRPLVAVFIAATAKYLFLFTTAFIYFRLDFVPGAFLQAMGTNQLFTALSGGLISFIILRFVQSKQKRSDLFKIE